MSAQPAAQSGTFPNKPVTRSSLRQSLNLASMGKVFVDAMHKDAKDAGEKEKGSKKSARRSSTVAVPQAPAARPPLDKVMLNKDGPSPDAKPKTLGRHARRTSVVKKPTATDSEDRSSSPQTPKTALPRSSTLRPRTSNGVSALPKYRPRPRSMLVEEAVKPPSPSRLGGKALNSSPVEKTKVVHKRSATLEPPSSTGKLSRSVSPIPHRDALKVDLKDAINVAPRTPEKKAASAKRTAAPPSTPRHGSSARPSKSAKTSSNASAARHISRPSSSASSSTSSLTPQTPRTGLFRGAVKKPSASSVQRDSPSPSPLRGIVAQLQDSPLTQASARKNQIPSTSPSPVRNQSTTPTASAFVEGNSTDSVDANDVEFLLSGVASPAAPTPALPRFRMFTERERRNAMTPPRPGFLPARHNLSYLSPEKPSSTNSSPFLRPLRQQMGNDRGSIMSWEQLAKHSRTLRDEDVDHMLSEMPAPFRSGAVSPSLSSSTHDVPESPTLSALPSPGGYGSISQVLLPDVTPSPAIHNKAELFDLSGDLSAEDGAAVTLLRLQLASAETKARDRLAEMESLESQLQTAKAARLRDTEELAKQISELEQQIHGNLHVDVERMEYITSLEDQLRQAQVVREQVVQEALQQMQERLSIAHFAALREQQQKMVAVSCAGSATEAWSAVRDVAEGELELIRANRETLTVLLAGLDQSHRHLACASV
ncbi:hypothetical protein DAEQUDRAFT_519592 [Daedalea quercina L-15889]|uniref:Uncharacterized protein n=1 Tax=Daedalea quercina L-15889 TaxID=1314783 RepID=A0A165MEK5_9APHY|nr:hypothetical protein DAEQUDRAFT_519592 [Daedalea quercina L-15889]